MTRQPLLTKPKKKRDYPESRLQKCIVQHLMLNGAPDMLYYSSLNGVRMSIRTVAHQKSIGMLPGVADLSIVVKGQAYFLEVKAKGGKQSPEQKAFEQRCREVGAIYAVADNIDQALAFLELWRAIKPAGRTAVTYSKVAA